MYVGVYAISCCKVIHSDTQTRVPLILCCSAEDICWISLIHTTNEDVSWYSSKLLISASGTRGEKIFRACLLAPTAWEITWYGKDKDKTIAVAGELILLDRRVRLGNQSDKLSPPVMSVGFGTTRLQAGQGIKVFSVVSYRTCICRGYKIKTDQ